MEKNVKLIIDESVSSAKVNRFEAFLKQKNIGIAERLLIAEKHSGIPDNLILHHLLDKQSIFITSDQPLHNKVLSKGFQSYYLDETQITGKHLKGIPIKPDCPVIAKDAKIKESYHCPPTALRPFLMPGEESKHKKLNTKRRRIRSHFGGLENVDTVALTVSTKHLASGELIGIRMYVSSKNSIKAITASENYILEDINRDQTANVAVCHSLILSIRLMLHFVKTIVYYDAAIADGLKKEMEPPVSGQPISTFKQLIDCFPNIEFVAASKGKHIEGLRSKLEDISKQRKCNEIINGDFKEIVERVASGKPVKTSVSSHYVEVRT